MPRGDIGHTKTVISLKSGALDTWLENVGDPIPENRSGENLIISELVSPRTGLPTRGLSRWRLSERTGMKFGEFDNSLQSLDRQGLLNKR